MSVRSILVFGYGNPSRGDDALGPLLIERLEQRRGAGQLQGVELLTDFQLQVEHVLDLRGRDLIVFADACITGPEPFSLAPVVADRDASYTTHAMSPGALLQVYQTAIGQSSPRSWLLAIRGYDFDLGKPLTARARENLHAAERYLLGPLREGGACVDFVQPRAARKPHRSDRAPG